MIVEFDEVCGSCGGTGVYVGMAERDGIGVRCNTCGGTGCFYFYREYQPFVKRVKRDDVKRVLRVNPGICVGAGKGYEVEDFGGMPYDDWWEGKDFPIGSEMRQFTCPAWYYQSADYEKKPSWSECNKNIGRFLSDCECFGTKDKCWERWDREFGDKEEEGA